jgi:hypothetical protein
MNSNSKVKMSIMRECYETLAKRLEYSTIIGFSCIVMTDIKIIKVMWYVAILVSAALTIYLIVINVQNYLQYSVVNQVTIEREFPMPFPTVTICNTNYFQTPYAKEYIQRFTSSIGQIDLFDSATFEQYYQNLDSVFRDLKSSVIEKNLTNDEIKKLGYSIEDILLNCKFGKTSCWYDDFKWIFLPDYGNCFQFNPRGGTNGTDALADSGRMSVTETGKKGGLSLELFIGIPTIMETFAYGYGAIVFINPVNSSLLSLSSVRLSPNTETNIVVSREDLKKLSTPYSECDILQSNDSSLRDLINSKGFDYKQSDCLEQCFQMIMIEQCGYYDLSKISYFSDAVGRDTINSCAFRVQQNLSDIDFLNENCYPLCPLECASSELKTSTSLNEYPSSNLAIFVAKNLISNLYSQSTFSRPLEKNILKVNIFFDSLSYTSITEVPSIDQITFISNIGGLLGLFLGATVLSFLELVEFVIIIFQIIKSRMSSRVKNQDTNVIVVKSVDEEAAN